MGRTVHYRSDTYWGLEREGVSCVDWRHWARMFWAGKFTNGVVHVIYGPVVTSRVCIRNTFTFPIEGVGKMIKWVAGLLEGNLFALIPANCGIILKIHGHASSRMEVIPDPWRFVGAFLHSHEKSHVIYVSVSQPSWDRGPVNSFFHKTRARSQQIYS